MTSFDIKANLAFWLQEEESLPSILETPINSARRDPSSQQWQTIPNKMPELQSLFENVVKLELKAQTVLVRIENMQQDLLELFFEV